MFTMNSPGRSFFAPMSACTFVLRSALSISDRGVVSISGIIIQQTLGIVELYHIDQIFGNLRGFFGVGRNETNVALSHS